jgi:hypothetical protein
VGRPPLFFEGRASPFGGKIVGVEAGSPSSKSARGSSGLVPLEGRIGGYELVARLGRGGAAEVFLARGPERALVVLKRLRDDAGDLSAAEDALLDEARLAERLVHPCIARTLGSGIEDGRRFLLLEPLAGQPLERLVDKAACEGERCALVAMLARALSGLHHAHEAVDELGSSLGVVHRDVSPHNLFVTYDGEVKVLDFGIALAASRSCATTTGLVKGKIAYMAPEQALSMPVDRRADVFSAGVVLAELWSGRRFWSGASDVQILRALTFGEVPEASSLVDEPALAAIVARATQVDPAARYESALELREALVVWLAADGHSPWLVGGQGLEREHFASLVRRWFGDEQRLLAELVAGAREATVGPAAALEPSASDTRLGEGAAQVQLEGTPREGDDAAASSERTQGNVALAVTRRERRGLAWVALALGLVGAAVAGLSWRRRAPAHAASPPERTVTLGAGTCATFA